jgi:hypothetical protein
MLGTSGFRGKEGRVSFGSTCFVNSRSQPALFTVSFLNIAVMLVLSNTFSIPGISSLRKRLRGTDRYGIVGFFQIRNTQNPSLNFRSILQKMGTFLIQPSSNSLYKMLNSKLYSGRGCPAVRRLRLKEKFSPASAEDGSIPCCQPSSVEPKAVVSKLLGH